MDGFDDDLEQDASRIFRDLSLFEVPRSTEYFDPNSTTPRRSDTSASEDFVKKRDVYLSALHSKPPQQQYYDNLHLRNSMDSSTRPAGEYGKILPKKHPSADYSFYDRNGNASRSVGAIESFVVGSNLQKNFAKDPPPAYSTVDRSSVIAASKFATPKQPVATSAANVNNGVYPYPAKPLPSRESVPKLPVASSKMMCEPYSSHSSPRSSLSSSSRDSQHSSPRASLTSSLYDSSTAYSPAAGGRLGMSSSSIDLKHSSPHANFSLATSYYAVNPTGDAPIYANVQDYRNDMMPPMTVTSAQRVYGNVPVERHQASAAERWFLPSAKTQPLPVTSQILPVVSSISKNGNFARSSVTNSRPLANSQSQSSLGKYPLPPPPPYPGPPASRNSNAGMSSSSSTSSSESFKNNSILNSKTLLPYNVTPPRRHGPSLAEKKIEALTKQLEDEMENNPEGEFFGKLFC